MNYSLPPALSALGKFRQFINYELVPKANGKTDKIPLNPKTLVMHDANDPSIHVSYEEAAATGRPVGFVFTENDPFFFWDLDDCLTPEGWSELSTEVCRSLSGCAVELSQSGQGLHVFGVMPERISHTCDNSLLSMGFYTERRFVALTGSQAVGDAGHAPPVETYRGLVQQYFPAKIHTESAGWTTEPDDEWVGPDDDDVLIKKMLKSKSAAAAFGKKAPLSALWEADEAVLCGFYPSEQDAFNRSEADAALCTHLAFWTGKDCERMDRLFRLSGLMREKWEAREEYRHDTITGSNALCTSVYSDPKKRVEDTPSHVFLSTADQLTYFRGLVYVRDLHKVLTPDGYLMTPEKFRTTYSLGKVFCIDNIGDKVTKNAWQAFTESQVNHLNIAFNTKFRPEMTAGTIFEEEGYKYVNTYVPIITKSEPGDTTPFTKVLDSLLPRGNDKMIMLSYMAACVQHPGIKFQWCPLLQGVQGNGKTFLAYCVAAAIGWRYTHLPNAKDIDNKFNAWLLNKLLIIVEEIYMPNKPDAMDVLKIMISGKYIDIQGKGGDQYTGDNRANFIMNSNFKDAVRKTENDRRFAVFYTDQQEKSDLVRCGITPLYMHRLYVWLEGKGYHFVNHFLRNFRILDELNPAKDCQNAPDTTSTTEAIEMSRSPLEQDIIEAIEEGRPGFSNGWMSSIAIKTITDKYKMSTNRMHDLIKGLEYFHHPALKGGRTNNIVIQEGGKPRIYIKGGHICQNITTPSEVRRKYMDAQGYATDSGAPSVSVRKEG
jgi:primase-polymerase (primpol)-like protein